MPRLSSETDRAIGAEDDVGFAVLVGHAAFVDPERHGELFQRHEVDERQRRVPALIAHLAGAADLQRLARDSRRPANARCAACRAAGARCCRSAGRPTA